MTVRVNIAGTVEWNGYGRQIGEADLCHEPVKVECLEASCGFSGEASRFALQPPLERGPNDTCPTETVITYRPVPETQPEMLSSKESPSEMRGKRFGVHPWREKKNAILDECENDLLESGVLESHSFVEKIPFLKHLGRMIPSLIQDKELRKAVTALVALIVIGVALIIIWPMIAELGEGLGGILSGKPLVPG